MQKHITGSENKPDMKWKVDAELKHTDQSRILLFPINFPVKTKGPTQWTLLAYDAELHQWTHYNPLIMNEEDSSNCQQPILTVVRTNTNMISS